MTRRVGCAHRLGTTASQSRNQTGPTTLTVCLRVLPKAQTPPLQRQDAAKRTSRIRDVDIDSCLEPTVVAMSGSCSARLSFLQDERFPIAPLGMRAAPWGALAQLLGTTALCIRYYCYAFTTDKETGAEGDEVTGTGLCSQWAADRGR